MGFSVREFSDKHDFEIQSVSYAGRPLNNTAMYVTKKVEYLLNNLSAVRECLVFVEDTVVVPPELCDRHVFVKTPMPQKEYAAFVSRMDQERMRRDRQRKYTLTEGGYYLGENVTLGENVVIEPRCLIGHDVVIGDGALIKSGATIKHARIGKNFIAGENCTIGTSGFTMADDENGDKIRIPTLGGIIIGDDVEIGCLTNVSCGSAGNTVIEDHVKVDALVHIGHDVQLHRNVELTCGTVLGGFDELHEGTFVGLNATLRNRITAGKRARISMGSVVTKSVPDDTTVTGNFAIPHELFMKHLKESAKQNHITEENN